MSSNKRVDAFFRVQFYSHTESSKKSSKKVIFYRAVAVLALHVANANFEHRIGTDGDVHEEWMRLYNEGEKKIGDLLNLDLLNSVGGDPGWLCLRSLQNCARAQSEGERENFLKRIAETVTRQDRHTKGVECKAGRVKKNSKKGNSLRNILTVDTLTVRDDFVNAKASAEVDIEIKKITKKNPQIRRYKRPRDIDVARSLRMSGEFRRKICKNDNTFSKEELQRARTEAYSKMVGGESSIDSVTAPNVPHAPNESDDSDCGDTDVELQERPDIVIETERNFYSDVERTVRANYQLSPEKESFVRKLRRRCCRWLQNLSFPVSPILTIKSITSDISQSICRAKEHIRAEKKAVAKSGGIEPLKIIADGSSAGNEDVVMPQVGDGQHREQVGEVVILMPQVSPSHQLNCPEDCFLVKMNLQRSSELSPSLEEVVFLTLRIDLKVRNFSGVKLIPAAGPGSAEQYLADPRGSYVHSRSMFDQEDVVAFRLFHPKFVQEGDSLVILAREEITHSQPSADPDNKRGVSSRSKKLSKLELRLAEMKAQHPDKAAAQNRVLINKNVVAKNRTSTKLQSRLKEAEENEKMMSKEVENSRKDTNAAEQSTDAQKPTADPGASSMPRKKQERKKIHETMGNEIIQEQNVAIKAAEQMAAAWEIENFEIKPASSKDTYKTQDRYVDRYRAAATTGTHKLAYIKARSLGVEFHSRAGNCCRFVSFADGSENTALGLLHLWGIRCRFILDRFYGEEHPGGKENSEKVKKDFSAAMKAGVEKIGEVHKDWKVSQKRLYSSLLVIGDETAKYLSGSPLVDEEYVDGDDAEVGLEGEESGLFA